MAVTGINPISSASSVYFPLTRTPESATDNATTFEALRAAVTQPAFARTVDTTGRGTLTLVENLPLPIEDTVIDAVDLSAGARAYLDALDVVRAANDNDDARLAILALDERARNDELLACAFLDRETLLVEETSANVAPVNTPQVLEQAVTTPNLPEESTVIPSAVNTVILDNNPVRLSQAVLASLNGQNLINTAPVFFNRPVTAEYDSGYTPSGGYRRVVHRAHHNENTPEGVVILNVQTNIGAVMGSTAAA